MFNSDTRFITIRRGEKIDKITSDGGFFVQIDTEKLIYKYHNSDGEILTQGGLNDFLIKTFEEKSDRNLPIDSAMLDTIHSIISDELMLVPVPYGNGELQISDASIRNAVYEIAKILETRK
jgi:hypothetical protein